MDTGASVAAAFTLSADSFFKGLKSPILLNGFADI
jgi:hypothetical protein